MRKSIGLSIISTIALSSFISQAGTEKGFTRADKNKDGIIQKQEFMDMRAGFAKHSGQEINTAQDERFFSSKDKDNSGDLTKKEFIK